MPMNETNIPCETCGTPTQDWNLNPRDTLFRCPSCGHIIRDMEACPTNARNHAWGGIGLFDRIRIGLTYRSINRRIVRTMEHNGQPTVLDVGFGAGLLLAKWIAKGWKTYGIEAELLDIPIEPEVREKSTLLFSKVEDADLPENTFELVHAIHVVEHLDAPKAVFEKLYSILKPNGSLYLITPNASSLGLSWFKAAWWNLEDPTHFRFFSPKSIEKMLQNAGFKDVMVTSPTWESVMVEANSLWRSLTNESGENGIFAKKSLQPLVALTALPFLALRLLVPRLSPSIEIIATK